jgi:type II secretory pathway component GspD/PulD (secretin)
MSRKASRARRWWIPLLAAVLLTAAPGATRRARAGDEEAAPKGHPRVQLQFTDPIALTDLLKAVSATTHTPLVWNPLDKSIAGRQVMSAGVLQAPPGELLDSLRALLSFYGLVMIPVGPADAQIMLVLDARQTGSILRLKPVPVTLADDNLAKYQHADGLFVTTTIHTEHIRDLRAVRNALARIVTGQNIGNVTEVSAQHAFVVTDFAPNVVAIYRLIQTMDRPAPPDAESEVRTVGVHLQHRRATDLAPILEHQLGSRQAAPRRARTAASLQDAEAPAPRIGADEGTNQVLLTGTPAGIARAQAALALLDVPAEAAAEPKAEARVVPLQHVHAAQTAGALQTMIHAAPTVWGAGAPLGLPTVVAHAESNSLLLAGEASALDRLEALVRGLDSER